MPQILEKNYIIWNNFNTKDNKILIEQLEVPPKAEERKELIQIEGRNGYWAYFADRRNKWKI